MTHPAFSITELANDLCPRVYKSPLQIDWAWPVLVNGLWGKKWQSCWGSSPLGWCASSTRPLLRHPVRMKAPLLREFLCIKSLLHSLSPAASTLYLHQVPWLVNNAASFLTPPYDPDEFLDVLCDCSPLFFSNSLFFILGFHPSSVLNPRHIQIKSWVQISLAWGTAGLKSYSKYMSANVCVHAHMHSWSALKDLWITVSDRQWSPVKMYKSNFFPKLSFQRKQILLPQSLKKSPILIQDLRTKKV